MNNRTTKMYKNQLDPSKHETLTQCWANTSPALGQRGLVFAGIVSVLVITLSLSTPSLHGIVNRQK